MSGNPRKVRVLLVVRWPVGGIRTFIRYTYRCSEFNKYRLTIVASAVPELEALRRDLSDHDVDIVPCHPGWINFHKAISHVLNAQKSHLVHAHGLTSALYASLAARLHRTPYLITLHDVFSNEHFSGLKGRLKHSMVARTLSTADALHTISHDVRTNLSEYFPHLDNSKMVAIRNGICIEQFHNGSPRNLREELGLTETDFLVGFLGRFMAQKGFRYLVDAIQALSTRSDLTKSPLVVAVGEGGYIREEKARIEQLGLGDYFRFLPFVRDITSTLRGLDVLTIPSLWEACPLLPMEAMVCGVPIIGTNCLGLREILADTPSTIIPSADSSALQIALETHMHTNANQISAERFAREAAERFDVRRSASALDTLYQQLMD